MEAPFEGDKVPKGAELDGCIGGWKQRCIVSDMDQTSQTKFIVDLKYRSRLFRM